MKTLFIIYYRLDIGGIQTKIIDIVNYVSRLHVRVFLILREKNKADRLWEMSHPDIRIVYYPDTVWSRIPFFFPVYVCGLTLKYLPDSILAFTFIPALCAIWAKLITFTKQVTVVLSEDWSTADDVSIDLRGNFPVLRKMLFRLFYHRADYICTVNNRISNVLIQKYRIPKTTIVRVYNWFSPKKNIIRRRQTQKKYDLIYVGRLEKIKNVQFLLSMIHKMRTLGAHISMCVVGSGSQMGALSAYTNTHRLSSMVTFTGFSDNPGEHMAQSRIFITASGNEGVPLSLLDAMTYKLPIISSRYPAVDEVVKHIFNGYVYSDEKECEAYIQDLLRNPRKRKLMGERGYRFVYSRYNPKNMNAYLRLLNLA